MANGHLSWDLLYIIQSRIFGDEHLSSLSTPRGSNQNTMIRDPLPLLLLLPGVERRGGGSAAGDGGSLIFEVVGGKSPHQGGESGADQLQGKRLLLKAKDGRTADLLLALRQSAGLEKRYLWKIKMEPDPDIFGRWKKDKDGVPHIWKMGKDGDHKLEGEKIEVAG
ncbi:hypothetical protein THAOC_35143, partial [Thalassiosira oceanica]